MARPNLLKFSERWKGERGRGWRRGATCFQLVIIVIVVVVIVLIITIIIIIIIIIIVVVFVIIVMAIVVIIILSSSIDVSSKIRREFRAFNSSK